MNTIRRITEYNALVSISFDDGTSLTLAKKHFEQRPLRIGACCERETYEQQLAAIQLADAYEAALCLLDYSAKPEKKLAELLRRKGYIPLAIDATLERLREARLVDDSALAKRFGASLSSKPIGRYAAQQKLRAKGFSEEDTESALKDFNEERQIRAAMEKLCPKYEKLPAKEATRKLSAALARRGFGWEAIRTAMEMYKP